MHSAKRVCVLILEIRAVNQVATTCQDLMHEAVAEEHEKAGSGEWKAVMDRSFARLDERAANWATTRSREEPACRCEQKMPSRCDHVGSTAVVAVVSPTQLVVANAGDSRAVLSRAGVPVALSVDHKVRLHHGVQDAACPPLFRLRIARDLTLPTRGFFSA